MSNSPGSCGACKYSIPAKNGDGSINFLPPLPAHPGHDADRQWPDDPVHVADAGRERFVLGIRGPSSAAIMWSGSSGWCFVGELPPWPVREDGRCHTADIPKKRSPSPKH